MQSVLNPYQKSTFTNTLTFGKSDLNARRNFLDEIKGEGNSLNYEFRMHDPRIGRFFALDPLTHSYPELTPYQFSSNSTIFMVELEGLEGKIVVTTKWYTDKGIEQSETKVYTVEGLKADLTKICWKAYGDPTGPVVRIDYYGRKEDGTRTSYYMKDVNPDAKPTVEQLNAFFSTPENSFNVKEAEKARVAAEKENKNWYDGTIFSPDALKGGDDGANTGNNAAGEQAPWPVKVIAGLNPLVSIPNAISVLTTDTDIYGVEASTTTDKVLAVLALVAPMNPGKNIIGGTTGKVVDGANAVTQSANDAGALDGIKR